MSWIDRLEKLGRFFLWLSIVAVLIGVPVSYASQHRAEAQLKEALVKAEAQLAEAIKPKAPERLLLKSMGDALTGLNRRDATGEVWFTNASPRSGVVCISGIAMNPDTKASTMSLPACQEVHAYSSAVHMTVMFAGRSLEEVCGKDRCDLHISEL